MIWIILISRNGTAKEFVSLNLVENVKKNFGNAWKELKLYPTVFRNKLVFSCILTVYFPISNKQYILEQNNSVLNACYLFSCMKISFCLWNWLQAKKQRALKRQLSIIQAFKSFTKLPGSRKKTLRMSLRSRLREKLSMWAFAKNPKCNEAWVSNIGVVDVGLPLVHQGRVWLSNLFWACFFTD